MVAGRVRASKLGPALPPNDTLALSPEFFYTVLCDCALLFSHRRIERKQLQTPVDRIDRRQCQPPTDTHGCHGVIHAEQSATGPRRHRRSQNRHRGV